MQTTQKEINNAISHITTEAEETDDPFFVVSVYPNGLMTVAVERSGDDDLMPQASSSNIQN